MQGQVFLKGGVGGWHFPYLIFSRFIIFTFRNYFTLCKIVLSIWRKNIFFCQHNFKKKGHFKLSKHSFLPTHKIRGGFLVFEIWTKRGSWKKMLRNRGVSWKAGVLLERGGFPNCFVSFPSEKHLFITIGFFCRVNFSACCNQ